MADITHTPQIDVQLPKMATAPGLQAEGGCLLYIKTCPLLKWAKEKVFNYSIHMA